MHEKKFVELENFQDNTTMFQTNINATASSISHAEILPKHRN